MQYGYFDNAAREYVLTNPKTPVKWINYIGTLAFGGFVDHTGGALLCKQDPALNRITKYLPQLPASSFNGTTLYLRFKTDHGYRVFSPFFTPTLDAYDRYECHVGLGYSRWITEFYGIRAEMTIFVPTGANLEVRDIRLTNLRPESIELDVVPVVEYTHFDALKQFTNADWIPQTMQSRLVVDADGQKILIQYPFMNRDRQINFLTSNWPVASFESDRARFLGDHEYGTWAAPLSLQQPELSNYEAQRGNNIGALLHHLGQLQPGDTRQIITQFGQATSVQAALPEIQRYRQPAEVQTALNAMASFWDTFLSRQQVETPEPAMNAMLNVHNPRQVFITMNWSRYLSLYQLGLGSRGIGTRDTLQDVMGVVANAPDDGRRLVEMLLHIQKRDGSALHQMNPLTMEGQVGDAQEMEDRPKYYGDDHLWSVLATAAYVKETGDLAFLKTEIPFYEKDKEELPIESASVLEHLRRALEFTRTNVGQHGLPLLGFADWNDTVNLPTGAESLFNANLYGKALLEMIALCEVLGDQESLTRYQADYAEMRQRVNDHAWDGAWYIRYFDHDGTPLGSQVNAQGKIYTNGQSWPVISGFATPERAIQALDSVYTHLNTRNGIKLSAPGFNGYDPQKGGITTYPPGAKENGGIFLHANPWVMIAETLIGRGDRAMEYYRQVNPAAKNDALDEFECEPYVYPQNILGDEHPQFGLARNSWLTGTASWMYQAATQYILGVRPTYHGLEINPCIPAQWDGFSVRRQFRGATYQIEVSNPEHVCKGVKSMSVDNTPVNGNIAPIFADGNVHQVHVILGKS